MAHHVQQPQLFGSAYDVSVTFLMYMSRRTLATTSQAFYAQRHAVRGSGNAPSGSSRLKTAGHILVLRWKFILYVGSVD